MAEKPVKDVLDEDDEQGAGAAAGEGAGDGAGAGGDGLDVKFADDAFDPDGPAAGGEAGDGTGDAAGDDAAGAGEGEGAGDELDDDDALSAGGEDDPAADAVDGTAGLAAGDETDDDAKYSKNVRARIARERKATRIAREEADAERVARVAAQKDSYQHQKTLVTVLQGSVKSQIEQRVAELKAAKEKGDTGLEVDIQQQINELTARRTELDRAAQTLEKEPDFEGATQPNRQANAWKDSNRWFGHPKFKAETALLRELDVQLAKSGVVKGGNRSAEYFVELNKRVAAEMPELRAKLKQVFRPAVNNGGNGASAGTRVAGVQTRGTTQLRAQSSGAKGRVVVLDKADVANMVNFKMDPKNPEHVREYARSKREVKA